MPDPLFLQWTPPQFFPRRLDEQLPLSYPTEHYYREIEINKIREAVGKLRSGPIGPDGCELLCLACALNFLGKFEEFHFEIVDNDQKSTIFSNASETGYWCEPSKEGLSSEMRFKITSRPSNHGKNPSYLRCEVALIGGDVFKVDGKDAFIKALWAGIEQKNPDCLGAEELKKFRGKLATYLHDNAERVAFYWQQAKANGLSFKGAKPVELLEVPDNTQQMGPFPYPEKLTPVGNLIMLAVMATDERAKYFEFLPRALRGARGTRVQQALSPVDVASFASGQDLSLSDVLSGDSTTPQTSMSGNGDELSWLSWGKGGVYARVSKVGNALDRLTRWPPGADAGAIPVLDHTTPPPVFIDAQLNSVADVEKAIESLVNTYLQDALQPHTEIMGDVKDFQEGASIACAVSLHGYNLPGLFAIYGGREGMLFSVLDQKYFRFYRKVHKFSDHFSYASFWPANTALDSLINALLPVQNNIAGGIKNIPAGLAYDEYRKKYIQVGGRLLTKKDLADLSYSLIDSAKKTGALVNARLKLQGKEPVTGPLQTSSPADIATLPAPFKALTTPLIRASARSDFRGGELVPTGDNQVPIRQVSARQPPMLSVTPTALPLSLGTIEPTQRLVRSLLDLRVKQFMTSLNRPNDPYGVAVNQFNTGQLTANRVSLNGRTLPGIFMIPVDKGGVLFSVLDKMFYKVGTRTNIYEASQFVGGLPYDLLGDPIMDKAEIIWKKYTEIIPDWPTNLAFQKWVNNVLPLPNISAHEFSPYFQSTAEFRNEYIDRYSLTNAHNKAELVNQLFSDLDNTNKLGELNNVALRESDVLIGMLAEKLSSNALQPTDHYTINHILPKRFSELHALAFPPISNPSYAIDKKIIQRLHKYEAQHGVTGLNPYSSIQLHILSNSMHGARKTDKKVSVTLRERLTRVYLGSDVTYQGHLVSFSETNKVYERIVNNLRLLPELKGELLEELAQYEGDLARKAAIKAIYRGQISQCIYRHLNNSSTQAQIKAVLNSVLAGKHPLNVVRFKGHSLAEMFAVKVGNDCLLFDMRGISAILLKNVTIQSVVLGSSSNNDPFKSKTDKPFRNLILDHLPIKQKIAFSDPDNFLITYKVSYYSARGMVTQGTPVFNYKEISGIDAFIDELASIKFQQIRSDIDTLIQTPQENLIAFTLEQAQLVMSAISPIVMMLPTGGGALTYRLGAFAIKLAFTSTSITLSALQVATAHTDAEEDEYRNNLIWATVLGIIDLAVPGRSLARSGVSTLNRYKQLIPALIKADMLWPTLVRSGQLNLLMRHLLQYNPVASALVKRFGQPWASKWISSTLSRTTIRTFTEGNEALQPMLNNALAEYRRTYPLTFLRTRPVNSAPIITREPIRETIGVSASSSLALPPALNNVHNELRAISNIGNMMLTPAENCEAILAPTMAFMQSKGMSNIQVRGMFIWANGGEIMPQNHFALRGRFGGKDYMFDLTAEQFPGIDGPLILPLAAWEQQYQQAWRFKLIKYQDFNTIAGANTVFGSQILLQAPMDVIPNAQVLAAPSWYKAQLQITAPSVSMPVTYGSRTPLYGVVRNSMLTSVIGEAACWDYAAEMLQQGLVLNSAQARGLVTQFQQLARSQNANIETLFQTSIQLTSLDEALRVPSGRLLVFVKDGHPAHAMVSLGGGNFAGMKNDALDPFLGSEKQIVSAEQLGEFSYTGLVPWSNSRQLQLASTAQPLTVYAGIPLGGTASTPSILEIAKKQIASSPRQQGLPQLTRIMEEACVLAPEQAAAFERQARLALMRGPLDPVLDWRTLISTPQTLTTSAALQALPQGGIVVAAQSTPQTIMLSLGDGNFASVDLVSSSVSSPIRLIRADEIPLTLQLVAGKVDVQNLRVSALLGPDASFTIHNHQLTIRAHGAPGIINHMDASELANGVRGLIIARKGRLDQVKHIEVQSCWGAFGRYSTGQALANKLNVPVTAYRWRYSARTADDWANKVKFEPMPAKTPQDLERLADMARGHASKHAFWSRLQTAIYVRHSSRLRRSATKVDWKEAYPQIWSVASLILQEQTIDLFLAKNPWFWGGNDSNLTDAEEKAFKVTMKEALGKIITTPDGIPISDELFKKRCEEVMTLNPYAYAYVSLLF